MTLPLVTTIIPSFNHARYIGQAIESVLAQDYPNIEFIVVDDGSTDDSHAVIRGYAERYPRIRTLLNTVNHGQSWVLNRAIEQSSGAFIQYLPSDDWYLPHKTRLQVEKFLASSERVGVVYGRGYRYFEETGETVEWSPGPMLRGEVQRALIEQGNFVYPVTPMFRRECFEREPLDESYRAEGEAIYPRFARHFEFDYVDEHVGVMRDHAYNTGKDVTLMYKEIDIYFNRVFSDPGLSPDIKALEPKIRGRYYRTKGLQFVGDRRNYKEGRQALLRAIRMNRRLIADYKLIGALLITYLPESIADVIRDSTRIISGKPINDPKQGSSST